MEEVILLLEQAVNGYVGGLGGQERANGLSHHVPTMSMVKDRVVRALGKLKVIHQGYERSVVRAPRVDEKALTEISGMMRLVEPGTMYRAPQGRRIAWKKMVLNQDQTRWVESKEDETGIFLEFGSMPDPEANGQMPCAIIQKEDNTIDYIPVYRVRFL